MRTQTVNFKDFMKGEHNRPIQYHGDLLQVLAWKVLVPFITVFGLELVLFVCEQLTHITVF